MEYLIFKQPNGLYLYFDAEICCPISYNLTESEITMMCLNNANEQIKNSIRSAHELRLCKDWFTPVNMKWREFYDIMRDCKKEVSKEKSESEDLFSVENIRAAKEYIRESRSFEDSFHASVKTTKIKNNSKLFDLIDALLDKELLLKPKEE